MPDFSPAAQLRIDAATLKAECQCIRDLHRVLDSCLPRGKSSRSLTTDPWDLALAECFPPIVDYAAALYDAYATEVVRFPDSMPQELEEILHSWLTKHLHDLLVPVRSTVECEKDVWDRQPPSGALRLLVNAWQSYDHPDHSYLASRVIKTMEGVADDKGYARVELYGSMSKRFSLRERYWVSEALLARASEQAIGLAADAHDSVQERNEPITHMGGVKPIGGEPPGSQYGEDPKAGTPAEVASFRKSGEMWILSFGGKTVHITDMLGLGYIVELLRKPRVPIEAVVLAGAGVESTQLTQVAGIPMADETTIKGVRRELANRKTELAGLSKGDWVRRGTLQEEIPKLEEYLGQVETQRGQARTVVGTAQHSRTSVTNAINRAIRHITKQHPNLGRHLKESIKTGTTPLYAPVEVPDWHF